MNTSYDIFLKAFLRKIDEYDLLDLPRENKLSVTDGYFKAACAAFRRICLYDLTDKDDEMRCFNFEIPDNDIDEIADVVSEGMVVQWLKPLYYKQENYENILSTSDFTAYSPANLLDKITAAYTKSQKDFINKMKDYSYDHGDLSGWHL